MGEKYDKIEKVESEISQWLKGIFLKERMLYGEMIELMLEAVGPPSGYTDKRVAISESALLTLTTRIFNDFEGVKNILLWGLPDQANIVMRDIIECMLLLRLFLRKPKKAVKWLINLKEYQPGSIYAELSRLGINAKEYSYYAPLSHEAHSNLLASLSHVQEMKVGEKKMLRVFHFGSTRTKEAEFFIQHGFLTLFLLFYITLVEPLAEYYHQHSNSDVYEVWSNKINDFLPKLHEIATEIAEKRLVDIAEIDNALIELTNRKMRFEEFKRRIGGS